MRCKPRGRSDLTLHDAAGLIADLRNPEKEPSGKSTGKKGRAKKEDLIEKAIKTDPVAVLRRAWEEASDAERAAFWTRIKSEFPTSLAGLVLDGLAVWIGLAAMSRQGSLFRDAFILSLERQRRSRTMN